MAGRGDAATVLADAGAEALADAGAEARAAAGAEALADAGAEAPDAPGASTRGNTYFHDRALSGLGGNGRACSDCHMDSNSFQLSPGNVEARFQLMRTSGIDDPLFRAIDA